MSAAAVECAGIWKFYGDYPALRDISLEVPKGRCLALIGRNGAGKTTLLRILAGFSKAGKGQVHIFGQNPRETDTRRRIGFIGHGIAVYDELSALENLRLFARLYQLPDAERSAREWLERTGLERVPARQQPLDLLAGLLLVHASASAARVCAIARREPSSARCPSPRSS